MDWVVFYKITEKLVLLLVGVGLDRLIERRPKLIVHWGHVATFNIRDKSLPKPLAVNTHAIFLRNVGRQPATNIRVVHKLLPDNYTVLPVSVAHQVVKNADGSGEIQISRLVPQEQIVVSYLYYPPLTYDQIHDRILHDQGFAKGVPVLLTRQLTKWQRLTLMALLVLGFSTAIYFAYDIILIAYGRWFSHSA